MTNRAHFLIKLSTEDGLANMMQALGRRCVQYINSAYKRIGTLWEGRLQEQFNGRDEYLIACSRYRVKSGGGKNSKPS
jgi:putative transposase